MNFLRRLFSSWHIFLAGIVFLVLYLFSPVLIRIYDPSAGCFDGGYLEWIVLGIALAFIVGFSAWWLWQLLFSSLDRLTANASGEWGNLEDWFDKMTPAQKWWAVQSTFLFCILLILVCLKLVPL